MKEFQRRGGCTHAHNYDIHNYCSALDFIITNALAVAIGLDLAAAVIVGLDRSVLPLWAGEHKRNIIPRRAGKGPLAGDGRVPSPRHAGRRFRSPEGRHVSGSGSGV
jgi:hypothetical protein